MDKNGHNIKKKSYNIVFKRNCKFPYPKSSTFSKPNPAWPSQSQQTGVTSAATNTEYFRL